MFSWIYVLKLNQFIFQLHNIHILIYLIPPGHVLDTITTKPPDQPTHQTPDSTTTTPGTVPKQQTSGTADMIGNALLAALATGATNSTTGTSDTGNTGTGSSSGGDGTGARSTNTSSTAVGSNKGIVVGSSTFNETDNTEPEVNTTTGSSGAPTISLSASLAAPGPAVGELQLIIFIITLFP